MTSHRPLAARPGLQVHETLRTVGLSVVGQGARVVEVVVAGSVSALATRRKLLQITKKVRELEKQASQLKALPYPQADNSKELKLVQDKRNFLLSVIYQVEEHWSDGSAIGYLDKILKDDEFAVRPSTSTPSFDPNVFWEPMEVRISMLENAELWPGPARKCVFIASEFNTASLEAMISTKNYFDAGNSSPRLYRRSERDVSPQLSSLNWGLGTTLKCPELLAPDIRLRHSETIDVVLRNNQYIIMLIQNGSKPSPKSVVIDRISETIQGSISERYRVNRVYDLRTWEEVQMERWAILVHNVNNVNEWPDFTCCGLAVA